MLPPIQINTNQQIYKQRQTAFRGNPSAVFAAPAEKSVRTIEFAGRKLINRICDYFGKKEHNALFDELLKADEKSPEYIKALSKVSRLMGTKNEIEINLESNRIQEIASSGKPHIFIMNHDNQSQDPKMMAVFNTLLNEEYLKTGQAAACPRPRIILNEDILLSMNKENRAIFDKLGAVPIDASLYSSDSKKNAKQFISLIRKFLKGEVNIFIFPEGKNSAYKSAPLENKFQLGVAELAAKIADKVPEVRVTPLGFAYNKKLKSPGDSIYIGKTVVLKKEGENMTATSANISSDFAKEGYKKFFKDKDAAVLTKDSVPVKGKELPEYVGGVLCENLRICVEEAKASLPQSSVGDNVLMV